MGLPEHPVTLTAEEIGELNAKLANLRHDVNNNLSLMTAALELIRFKPELSERMLTTISEQPAKIGQAIEAFSSEFEKAFGIERH